MSVNLARGSQIFDSLRRQMDELALFANIARNGMSWGQAALKYEEVVKAMSDRKYQGRSLTEKELEERRAHAAKLQSFAEDQDSKGFPYLYNLLAIRVWTILENLVDEFAATRVQDPEKLPSLKGLEGLSVPLLQFVSAGEDARTEFIVDAIKQATKSRLKIGVGRFESLLDAVGLGGGVSDPIRKIVLELSEIRNVLIHRDGFCDGRICERCPWLSVKVGQKVSITEQQFHLYRLLPVWYNFELHRRAGDVAADAIEPLNEAIQELEKLFESGIADSVRDTEKN